MIAVEAELDRASVTEFQRALHETRKWTRRSLRASILYGAKKAALAGKDIAKPGAKYHEVRKVEATAAERRVKARQRFAWVVIKLGQTGKVYQSRYSTQAEANRHRKIEQRGLARRSWGWLATAIHSRSHGAGDARKWVRAILRGAGDEFEVTLTNRLTYLRKAFPGIESRALHNAARGMDAEMKRRHGAELERAWR